MGKRGRKQIGNPLTACQRSGLGSRIRSKHTEPEVLVGRIVRGMGYRYRLHAKEQLGWRESEFRRRRGAIVVRG